ncbi:MAG TPA: TetR/AcrR family transcriptional regulator [Sphingobium sp.]|nr:TetR/AcrR family transcriptional regulator [Sphingobium sp.]
MTRVNIRREERRRAVLVAAEGLFLEQGYERVSVNAIVRRSGGSLATFYDMFGNKQGLLRAVVDQATDEELKGLDDIYSEGKQPGATLRKLALRYYAFATTPRMLALTRLVIGQSLVDPAFGNQFHQDLQLRFSRHLAEAFARWTAEGKAQIAFPSEAADLYFAIVMCNAPFMAMFGIAPEPVDDERLERRLAPFIAHYHIA